MGQFALSSSVDDAQDAEIAKFHAWHHNAATIFSAEKVVYVVSQVAPQSSYTHHNHKFVRIAERNAALHQMDTPKGMFSASQSLFSLEDQLRYQSFTVERCFVVV